MYLKSLEMQGFKSFPDKTVFNFGKGMTAVVGPNGSGKSNIADAVKWVLGEQSTKSLRGSKMEDVIFSGTNKRKAQGYAQVTLKLDNSDRAINKDCDEVAVTRKFYRSGESEYKINGETVRLRDVNELFMDTGMGRDGYSMVGQGKIENIVSSKSTDRREMFEEAAGISHYRYRRADALKRLDGAEDNLIRLRDILTELESRVGPLEKQSEKAQKFLVLAEDRKKLEIGIWIDILNKSSGLIREQNNKLDVVSAHYESVCGELDKIYTDTESIQNLTTQTTLQIEEIHKSSSLLDEQIASADGLIAVNKNSVEHNNETIKRIENDKLQENYSVQQIDKQIEEHNDEIRISEEKIESKKKETEELNEKLTELQIKNTDVSDECLKLSVSLNDIMKKLNEAKICYSAAFSSSAEINERLSVIDTSVKEKENSLEILEEKKSISEKYQKECENKVSELTNAVTGHLMLVKSKSQNAENLKFALDKLSLDIEQIKSKILILEDMEKNMDGYSGSVKAVMRESSKGLLKGIHGTMSQIISVKSEYSLAIETALGAAIQHIVTDNEQDAKRAMNYLKENNSGRATFFPLSTLKARDLGEKGLENCDGYIDIASKLIDCDEIYRELVQNQLGKTVVVDDIDSAIAIAKKYQNRFKIVTLDGQVINTGGSMTGGSKIKSAGFLTRQVEIENLKKSLEDENKKFIEYKDKYNKSNEDLKTENGLFEKSKSDLSMAQEEKIKADSSLRMICQQFDTEKSDFDKLVNEKKSANERLDTFAKVCDDAKKAESDYNADIQIVQSKLDALSVDRNSMMTVREEITSQISQINVDIASFMRDVQSHKDMIKSLNDRKDGQSDRLKYLDNEIKQIELKNQQLNDRIAELEEEKSEIKKQSDESKRLIDDLIEKRNNCEKQVTELRLSERKKTEEKEQLAGEVIRLENKKATLEKEQNDTQTSLYEEYKLTRREAEELQIEIESVPQAKRQLAEVKSKIKSLGNVNVSAIEEYKEVLQRYTFMKTQMDDVEKSKNELIKMINELTENMAVRFAQQFDIINKCFVETFSSIFGGGKAELILEDPNNILECGIEIKAQPPGKNVKSISLLSGGEKGLCAIALLFAILKVRPAPFCIFDEVEAALDDVNVLRYAQYVRNMTDNTQFILITHRRGTMEESDLMYGVTMQEKGVSKILELKTSQMAEQLGLE